jgi:hypothetical protein
MLAVIETLRNKMRNCLNNKISEDKKYKNLKGFLMEQEFNFLYSKQDIFAINDWKLNFQFPYRARFLKISKRSIISDTFCRIL